MKKALQQALVARSRINAMVTIAMCTSVLG